MGAVAAGFWSGILVHGQLDLHRRGGIARRAGIEIKRIEVAVVEGQLIDEAWIDLRRQTRRQLTLERVRERIAGHVRGELRIVRLVRFAVAILEHEFRIVAADV